MLFCSQVAFSANGGEGDNTGCNGVGNVNSPCQGNKGDKGDKGDQGNPGNNGQDGQNGEPGSNGEKGQDGKEGSQGVRGPEGQGLKDRTELLIGARVYEGRRWTTELHGGRDFNNEINIVEVRCTRRFGKSYTDKRIEKLESLLAAIENSANSEIYYTEKGMGIREK